MPHVYVTGGLIINLAALPDLHTRIHWIRKKFGYKAAGLLKFDTNARPKHVSLEHATAAKNAVIKACIEFKCKFIAYVVLHAIAKTQPANKLEGPTPVTLGFNVKYV